MTRPTIQEALRMSPLMTGECLRCPSKPAVACGKRLCAACNRDFVAQQIMPIPRRPRARTKDEQQSYEGDANPWQENAIRAMEDG